MKKQLEKKHSRSQLKEHNAIQRKMSLLLKALNDDGKFKSDHPTLYYEMKDAVVSWISKFETSR